MGLFTFFKKLFFRHKRKKKALTETKRIFKKISKDRVRRKRCNKRKQRKPKKISINRRRLPKLKKSKKSKGLLRKEEKRKNIFKEKEIGVVTHYFGRISVGVIRLKSSLRLGERIHIKGAHDDFVQIVDSMQITHKDISYAKKGAEVGIKVIKPLHKNSKVYKIIE